MANGLLVIATTGFGKSTSYGKIPELNIKGLDPTKTVLINIAGKPLPFAGWKKAYDNSKKLSEGGNYVNAFAIPQRERVPELIKILDYIEQSRPEIENILFDDFQYLMADEFMTKALLKGFDKFSELAKNTYDIIKKGINMRNNINFIILTHSDTTKEGDEDMYKMKTIGKMLDEKVTLEGLFTTVLYGKSVAVEGSKIPKRMFVTNRDGVYPAKTPIGMFKMPDELYIPNDLGLVVERIRKYENGEQIDYNIIETDNKKD